MISLPVISDSERDHVRADLCGPCGGLCCKASPGIASPADFGAPDRAAMVRRVREAVASGLWAVDWWDGDPRGLDYEDARYVSRAYYVRPAERGKEGTAFDPSWGGACTFHDERLGCRIFATRPQGCRDLIPGTKDGDYHCGVIPGIGDNPKHRAALAWLPYRDVIGAIFAPDEAPSIEPTDRALRRAAAGLVSYADTSPLVDIMHAMRIYMVAHDESQREDAATARAWMAAYEAMTADARRSA